MKTVMLAGLASLALLTPAQAFDNTTCKTFLAGTWNITAEIEQNGQKYNYQGHSVYTPEGTLTQHRKLISGDKVVQETDVKGTWDAKPGAAADECEVTLTLEGQPAKVITATVVDENSVKGPDGNIATREH